jgi:hypothetical protein
VFVGRKFGTTHIVHPWKRVSEHLRAFKNPNAPSHKNSPFARHRNSPNHLQENVCPSVKILAHSRKVVERKVAEAYYIFDLKPTINGKEKMEGSDLLIDRRDFTLDLLLIMYIIDILEKDVNRRNVE